MTLCSPSRTPLYCAPALLMGALALGLFVPAVAYEIEDDFYELTEEYVSPHIKWAKPYAGERVRALFIVPRGTAREVIEVAQRLDLDYDYLMTLSDKELGWTSASSHYALAEGISYEDMARQLKEKLEGDYDVIVTGHLDWSMFPDELLYAIVEKIHDGAGLVHGYAGYGRNKWMDTLFDKPEVEAPFVTAGVPWQALPAWGDSAPGEFVETRQFHDGRMVLLNCRTLPRFMSLTPTPAADDRPYRELHYEYYQSLLIKAILWAAKREPQVGIAALAAGGDPIPRSDLPRRTLTCSLTQPGDGLTARMVVRDEDNRELATDTAAVTGLSVSFPLPVAPAGRYFADVWLGNEAGTVNWGSVAFEVTSDPSITAVTLEPFSAQPAQTVSARAELGGTVPAESSLRLEVTDNLGRLLLRRTQDVAAAETEATLDFAVEHPLALSAEVRVSLLVGDETVDYESADLYTPIQVSRGNFGHMVWSADGNSNEFVRRLMLRRLHDCDVDTFTNSSVSPTTQAWSARNNFDTMPYATRYFYSDKDLVRSPCLTDPDWLSGHLTGLEGSARGLAPYRPRAYTLGDECFLARGSVDVCFSETCIADLRQWLRTEYDTVDELNRSWGTEYASFDDAEPITLSDAQEADQPARWVDHRRHMEFVYARMMERAEDAIRKGDPNAEVGFDGPFATDSVSGNDWWRLMKTFDMCNVYFHQPTQWEFLRSFARPGMLLGLWYGGYFENRTEDEERMYPWRGLLNGFTSMWWYAVYHGLATCPMDAVTPSMTIYPAFQWASEEIHDIQAGIGNALMGAERLHDGIGVHYSQSSLHAATWGGGWGRLDQVWQATFSLLEDMGLQYKCRAYEQIENEGIDAGECPVFILPYSQAVSPREAEALRRYVQSGGMLIADVRPGVCDHHGKPVSPGLLDDLFGIRRQEGSGRVPGATVALTNGFEGFQPDLELTALMVDDDVRVDGGVALGYAGDVPAVVLKRTGRGLACLLNYGFGSAAAQRTEEAGLAHWRLLRGLMALNGVAPACSVTAGDGPLRKLETVRYQDGPAEYVAFRKERVNAEEPTRSATVRAGGVAHTYDCRQGAYLGETSEWTAEFVPARTRLYARMPYVLESMGVSARCEPGASDGEGVGPMLTVSLRLSASAAEIGRHWVHITLLGPDGEERKHYRRNVPTRAGAAEVAIPLALNDPPGNWRVAAREVATGTAAETAFELPG